MINPILWGKIWDFLHHLSWIFPNEILSLIEIEWMSKFLETFSKILPCIDCSQSASRFIKELNFEKNFYFKQQIVTRSHIAKFFWILHNRVNVKLGKPIFGNSWYDSIQKRPKWRLNLLRFLFALGFNLLFQQEEGYKLTFSEFQEHYTWLKTTVSILHYDSIFECLLKKFSFRIKKMIEYPLTMIDFCHKLLNLLLGRNVSLLKIQSFFNLGKPKKDCSFSSDQTSSIFIGSSKQGCQ